VSWGDYARFVAYTAKLNWFLPAAMIPTLAKQRYEFSNREQGEGRR
jgi:hypothetical protein